ncbi:MAG: hypothetical protein GXO74_07160, partial [Calditrichaeota bacterium]|nr:hypothetical protein [Calditrichota bacterium]
MKKVIAALTLISVVALFVIAFAQDAKTFKYVGVKKCKMCHKGAKKGQIYETWMKAKHAKAFETLGT